MNNLTELINLARGTRSVEDFARECGYSKSTLYRIIRGGYLKPIPDQLLHAIIEHAAPDSNLTYQALREASEAERKKNMQTLPMSEGRRLVIQERVHESERRLSQLIVEGWLDNGWSLEKIIETKEPSWDLVLTVKKGNTVRTHCYEFKVSDTPISGIHLREFYCILGMAACDQHEGDVEYHFVIQIDSTEHLLEIEKTLPKLRMEMPVSVILCNAEDLDKHKEIRL